jgi:hypothetical protein
MSGFESCVGMFASFVVPVGLLSCCEAGYVNLVFETKQKRRVDKCVSKKGLS